MGQRAKRDTRVPNARHECQTRDTSAKRETRVPNAIRECQARDERNLLVVTSFYALPPDPCNDWHERMRGKNTIQFIGAKKCLK